MDLTPYSGSLIQTPPFVSNRRQLQFVQQIGNEIGRATRRMINSHKRRREDEPTVERDEEQSDEEMEAPPTEEYRPPEAEAGGGYKVTPTPYVRKLVPYHVW